MLGQKDLGHFSPILSSIRFLKGLYYSFQKPYRAEVAVLTLTVSVKFGVKGHFLSLLAGLCAARRRERCPNRLGTCPTVTYTSEVSSFDPDTNIYA